MIKNVALSGKTDRIRLLLGLALGLVAAGLIAVFLIQAKEDGSGGQLSGDTVPAVVAAQDIAAGTRLSADMVTVKELPAGAVLAGALAEPSAVVGKVTTVPLVQGEQVLSAKISDTNVDLTKFKGDLPLALAIPQGRRAYSIEVSEVSAAGGLIRPGDYVDVLASGQKVSAEDSSQTVGFSCYVAQDIQVVAVGQTPVKTTPGSVETPEEMATVTPDKAAASVTLAVTPQEAAGMAAMQRGVDGNNVQQQLWLAVRPFGEHGVNTDLPACQ